MSDEGTRGGSPAPDGGLTIRFGGRSWAFTPPLTIGLDGDLRAVLETVFRRGWPKEPPHVRAGASHAGESLGHTELYEGGGCAVVTRAGVESNVDPAWVAAMTAIVVALASGVWRVTNGRVSSLPHYRRFQLYVVIPACLRAPCYRFGVRHVRDGKDAVVEHTPPLNRDHWLRNGRARLWHDARLGVQFKCYVDFGRGSFVELKDLLERAGFHEVTLSTASPERRAWFLIPGRYERTVSKDGYVNNFGTVTSGPPL